MKRILGFLCLTTSTHVSFLHVVFFVSRWDKMANMYSRVKCILIDTDGNIFSASWANVTFNNAQFFVHTNYKSFNYIHDIQFHISPSFEQTKLLIMCSFYVHTLCIYTKLNTGISHYHYKQQGHYNSQRTLYLWQAPKC